MIILANQRLLSDASPFLWERYWIVAKFRQQLSGKLADGLIGVAQPVTSKLVIIAEHIHKNPIGNMCAFIFGISRFMKLEPPVDWETAGSSQTALVVG